MTTPEHVSPATLRTLFLFEDLQGDQLEWVAEHSHIERYGAGPEIATKGAPAKWFHLLLSGAITLSRLVRGDDVEITRSDQPGVHAGTTQFYFGDQVSQVYTISVRTIADSTVLALPAADFAVVFRQWYPMAMHLLQGMFVGLRNADELVGQRERLLASSARWRISFMSYRNAVDETSAIWDAVDAQDLARMAHQVANVRLAVRESP